MKRSSDWSSILSLPPSGWEFGGRQLTAGWEKQGEFVSAGRAVETLHVFCFHVVRISMEVLTLLSKFS